MFRTGYNVKEFDPNKISDESGLRCPQLDEVEPGMFECLTDQSFAEEVNINTIIDRFGIGEVAYTGTFPEFDATGITDFQSAMNLIKSTEDEFMRLPAKVREKFDHNPGRLLAFLNDEKNRDEAIELGIVNKPPEKTRDVVQAVDELRDVLKPKA